MTPTLEQELAQLIESEDYRVSIWASGDYLRLRIVYLPKLRVRGEGALSYIANGVVAETSFRGRNPMRRWRKAKKWALAEIAGHREFLQGVLQA